MVLRFRLSTVAEAFIDLQQVRHEADYETEWRSSHSMRQWM